MDILEHIAAGVTNDEIAQALYLSINSIKSYIRAAYTKIGATSRSQAVLWAIEHGLAHPERASEPSRS
jgi:DNA-binding NarL/FixJ family response regulator